MFCMNLWKMLGPFCNQKAFWQIATIPFFFPFPPKLEFGDVEDLNYRFMLTDPSNQQFSDHLLRGIQNR